MNIKFKNLNNTIIKCKKCPRLVKFRKKISVEKRKQYENETYWGKPITGFGDPKGKILFVGSYGNFLRLNSCLCGGRHALYPV